MAVHLMRETDKLKEMVLSLAAHVEDNVRTAARAVAERDNKLAYKVIESDRDIDEIEVDIEEECLKILALHQPVAQDLRYIVAIIKINRDLERIGDLAVTISERAIEMLTKPHTKSNFDFDAMADKCQEMVSKSLDSMINLDTDLAKSIWLAEDDEVDRMTAQAFELFEKEINKHPENCAALTNMLSVAQALERISDHATNIAKDTIYMVEGNIVRHRKRKVLEELAAQGRTIKDLG